MKQAVDIVQIISEIKGTKKKLVKRWIKNRTYAKEPMAFILTVKGTTAYTTMINDNSFVIDAHKRNQLIGN